MLALLDLVVVTKVVTIFYKGIEFVVQVALYKLLWSPGLLRYHLEMILGSQCLVKIAKSTTFPIQFFAIFVIKNGCAINVCFDHQLSVFILDWFKKIFYPWEIIEKMKWFNFERKTFSLIFTQCGDVTNSWPDDMLPLAGL